MAERSLSRRSVLGAVAALAGLGLLAPGLAVADPTTEELQAELDEARSQLESMGNALAGLQDTLAAQTEAIEITRSSIYDIETQMAETQTQLDEKRTTLSERMRSSYKEGPGSTLELILGATTVEELVSRIYYLDKLSKADAATIASVNELAARLQTQRDALSAQEEEQESQLEATQESLDEYEAQLAATQSYYESLDAEVQERLAEEAAEEAARQAAESEASHGAQTTGIANAVTAVGGTASGEGSSSTTTQTTTPSQSEGSSGESDGSTSSGSGSSSGSTSSGSSGSSGSGSSSTGHPEIVAAAETLLGKPYKQWQTGVNYGPDADGYDCCGLVATAYHLCGYSYPAYQAPVSSIMSTIKSRGNWKDCSLSNYQSVLSPGDVIVCSTGHVAVYAGGDQMIHAPYVGAYVCYARVYACIGGGFGG